MTQDGASRADKSFAMPANTARSDPQWIDLRVALVLDCCDGNELVPDWHQKGFMPGLQDVPFLTGYMFHPSTGTIDLELQENTHGPRALVTGDIAALDNAEALVASDVLSPEAIAAIRGELRCWIASNCHYILEQARAGHIELSGRPNSLFADERPIPSHVLPYLDAIDLSDGTIMMSNGEVIFAAKSRVKIKREFTSPPTGADILKAKLKAIRKNSKLRPYLRWIIADARQRGFSRKAKERHYACEKDMKTNWEDYGAEAYRSGELRTFGSARALYREIMAHGLLEEVENMLD